MLALNEGRVAFNWALSASVNVIADWRDGKVALIEKEFVESEILIELDRAGRLDFIDRKFDSVKVIAGVREGKVADRCRESVSVNVKAEDREGRFESNVKELDSLIDIADVNEGRVAEIVILLLSFIEAVNDGKVADK